MKEKTENLNDLINLNNPNQNKNMYANKIPHPQSSKTSSRKNSIYNDLNNSQNNLNPKNRDLNLISSNNGNKSLLRNVQFLEEENNKLRELLSDLNNEMKEKEEALNESQKIILKLKEEYSQIMKEYKKVEIEKNKLLENKENTQKIFDNMSKNQIEFEKITKQNEQLKQELMRLKGNINYYKSYYSNITNDLNKLEKNNKTKELIIKDLKIEGDKCVNMLQDRELLIETYSKKINELNNIINQKNEQLKLMVNFSKEINNENKSNVKEITKQAVKTIKVFYNTLNNKDNKNQINFIEIKNSKVPGACNCNSGPTNNTITINQNDINLVNYLYDNKLNNQNCSMYLIDSLKDLLYIPEEGVNYINKEFLIDNNFKTCLLKTELFSSLIREYNLNNYLKEIFGQLDISIAFKTGIHDKLRKLNDFKFQFDQMKTAFNAYLKDNILLKNKLNDLNLYVEKLKRDFDKKNQKYKNKINELLNLINSYEDYLDNSSKNKNNTPNNLQKFKDEISNLHLQLDKTNNDNHNLNDKILEKEKIIDNLKKEIDKLNTKLNALRTNPLAQNNINIFDTKEMFTQTDKKEGENIIDLRNNKNLSKMQNDSEDIRNKKLNGSSSSLSYYKKEKNKYYSSSSNNKLEIQPNERFTYFLNSFKKNKNISLNNITPIKLNENINLNNNLNENNIVNINENNHEINSLSKLTNFDNILDAQQHSELTGRQEIINNNNYFIDEFKRELNENNFMEIAQRNVKISKIFSFLTSKVEQIKNIILSVKEKLKKINKDKKISPHHFIQVLNQLEKYVSYIFIHLNRSNGELLSILPTVSIIYNLISKFIYNKSFKIYPDMNNNKYDYEINTLQMNSPIEDINIEESKNATSRESSIPNYRELKQFFDINKKIFSTSELIKYRNIYNNLSMSQIIKVFKETCNNLKKTIHNLRTNYRSSMSEASEFDETINSRIRTQKGFTADSDDYRIVNEKILKLKKFEFDFKILMELLKNYLVCFEIIVKKIEKEFQLKNKSNLIQLGEEINIIFNLFEDVIYYKMEELDDDTIFNRKVILKLMQNHKEYLTIVYDLRY
jgi:archaellum component FlaC